MPATTTMFRAARPVFQQSVSRTAFRTTNFNFSRQTSRRFASTTAANEAAAQTWFQRMWNSPVGLKTVHFWAPVMKWAIVIAGISDFARPAEKLSLTQNGALTATGLIWTRWCFVITPKNYLLAAVNFFLGCVGVAQCARIFVYRSSLKEEKNKSLPAAAEAKVEEVKEAIKS